MDRPPILITLPTPSLVVLIGPAGAGKSTFARRSFSPEEVVSSDDLRLAIAGDVDDQSRNGAVFRALHRAVATRSAKGETVVVDATNVEWHARRPLLRIAAELGGAAVAIVFDLPLVDALARNAARPGRTVDPMVVRRQHDRLAAALASGRLAFEGFERIVVLEGVAAIDAAVVRRGSPGVTGGSSPGGRGISRLR